MTADLDTYISGKVASGEFKSREEFLREAARLYRDLEDRYSDLRETIQERIRQADAGDIAPLDFDAIKADGRRMLAARKTISSYR